MQGHIGRGGARLLAVPGALHGLVLVCLRARGWLGVAVGACAWALASLVLGAGQAWASGSTSYFSKLTGAGQALSEARGGAFAVALPSGQVLIAGGYNANGLLTSAELFNAASDTFTDLAGSGHSLAEARWRAVAAMLPSGQVLVAGGENTGGRLSSAELFNPATNTFTRLTGSGQSLTEARVGAVAAALPSGLVLVAGGYSGSSYLSSAELFNPASDTFTKLTGAGQSLSQTRDNGVAATLPSGQVLVAGGENGGGRLSSAELFNPATDAFSKLTGAGQVLTEPRGGAIAATLPSGQVLIAGGEAQPPEPPVLPTPRPLSSAELFNPATDTFTKLGQSLNEPRDDGVAAMLPSGQVLIAGGYAGKLNYLSSAELFIPAAQAQVAGGSFGGEVVGRPSAPGVLTVTSVGAQALSISGATLAGADATDFAITADACEGATLAFAQQCTISMIFTPASEGEARATLTLKDNESEPAVVTLSGTSIAQAEKQPREQGPGPQGPEGAKRATEAQTTPEPQPTGAPTSRARPKARAAHVALVTCTTSTVKSRTRRHCTTRVLEGAVTVAASTNNVKASLRRRGKLYATGMLTRAHDALRLVLNLNHRKTLPPGTYTLTLRWTTGKTTHTSRQRVKIEWAAAATGSAGTSRENGATARPLAAADRRASRRSTPSGAQTSHHSRGAPFAL